MASIIERLGLRSPATTGQTPPVVPTTNTTGTPVVTPPVVPTTNTTGTPVVTPPVVDTAAVVNETVNPVLQAKLQLTGKGQTQIDSLYENTVTKTSNVFYKFGNWLCFQFGKLSSTSAYGRARAHDVAVKAASKDFNDAVTGLIDAAFKKNLSDAEAREEGIPTAKITTHHFEVLTYQQNSALNANANYQAAVNKFSQAFSAALVADGPNPTIEKVQHFMNGAIEALSDESAVSQFALNETEILKNTPKVKTNNGSKTLTQIKLPQQKLNMAITSFVHSVYHDEVMRFANQDVANITPASIAAKAEYLEALFPRNSKEKIIRDLCSALMGNRAIAQEASRLINPDAIQSEVAARRAGLNLEKEEILRRLAQLCKHETTLLRGRTFEGQLDQAWRDWKGYQAAGRASPNAGKVLISVDGNDVEVDGQVGVDALGHSIGNDVWVFGKEQIAVNKLLNFIGMRRSLSVTTPGDQQSVEALAPLAQLDVNALGTQLTTAQTDIQAAISQYQTAKERYEHLEKERQTKELRLVEIELQNEETMIRHAITSENNTRSEFLNLFVHTGEDALNHAVRQLDRVWKGRPLRSGNYVTFA